MKKIFNDLYQSNEETPFNNQVKTVSYFIPSNHDNYLMYSSSHILNDHHKSLIKNMGGVKAQLLNHRDEASPILQDIRKFFQSKLICHILEKESVEKYCPIDLLLEKEQSLFEKFEIIHTPGHVPGSTSFLFKGISGNYLFTGDTLYLSNGEFRVAIAQENRLTMIQSLLKLKDLEVHGIFPGLYIGKESYRIFENKHQFSTQIVPLIKSLQDNTFQ